MKSNDPDGGETQVEGEDVASVSGEELDLDAPELPMDDDVAAGHPKPRLVQTRAKLPGRQRLLLRST